MVGDAVNVGSGEDFTLDGAEDDVGGAATGVVFVIPEGIAEAGEIFEKVYLESVCVVGFAFAAFSGGEFGNK